MGHVWRVVVPAEYDRGYDSCSGMCTPWAIASCVSKPLLNNQTYLKDTPLMKKGFSPKWRVSLPVIFTGWKIGGSLSFPLIPSL